MHNSAGRSSQSVSFEMLESRRLFAAVGTITGIVFDDKNGNGVRETGELPLANQMVYIDANNNGVRDGSEQSVLTDSTGTYTFTRLEAGTYRVRHELPAGRRLTFPTAIFYDAVIPISVAGKTRDFGNTTMGVVRGTIFNDLNSDGQKQPNEPPLAGWRVFLDKDGDGIYNPGLEKTRLTNSHGEYRFADLTPGKYVLRVVQQPGFTRINPLNGMFKFTMTVGKSFSNRNFAEHDDSGKSGIDM